MLCGVVGGFASAAVVVAFGGYAPFPVLGAGVAAFGHHRGAFGAVGDAVVGVDGGHAAGRGAQGGEQQGAARGGDVCVSGGCVRIRVPSASCRSCQL